MGILGGIREFVSSELLEIIEWTDDSRDTLAWRFPDDDKEIKRGAQLVVRESQAAQFVHLGQFADTFGPGLHRLTTENIPVLTTLKGWKYGFESPFKADVYFVTTRLFTGQKWGTQNPIMLRDQDFGLVRARAFGTYDVQVTNPAVFVRSIVGTSPILSLPLFVDSMRPRLIGAFSEALAKAGVPLIDVATRYREVGASVQPMVSEVCERDYGVAIRSFVIENISAPTEVEQAIDKRAGMAAIGNLDDYVKFKAAEGLAQPGGSGIARMAAEFAIGQQLAQAFMPKKEETTK